MMQAVSDAGSYFASGTGWPIGIVVLLSDRYAHMDIRLELKIPMIYKGIGRFKNLVLLRILAALSANMILQHSY